ncbi:MAG: hypothetical protein WB607_00725 [Candidatus Acidiferrum sp.]|jgi:hypothetical protein
MIFPGCFRCHDGSHTSADGQTISKDCSAGHNLLALQEEKPKILTDPGMQQLTVVNADAFRENALNVVW